MADLFYMGGPLFMGILTLIFLVMLVIAVYQATQLGKGAMRYETTFRYQLSYIKSVGVFALVFGILGQLIGLYQAFSAIEQAGAISPALLAGGLKVSMITTLYGLFIFLISWLIWMGLDYAAKKLRPVT